MSVGRLAVDPARRIARSPRAARDLGAVAAALGGLWGVVALRWGAIAGGQLDGISIGLLFGLGLVAVGVAAGRLTDRSRSEPPPRSGLAARRLAVNGIVGLAGGLGLIAVALVARAASPTQIATPIGLGPAALFAPWLAVTTLVALAEELVLRGVLFSAIERLGGAAAAVAVTSVVFALMHVPVYGWHVVPLDLGVGVFLGGLRLATGRWLAPGVAHVVADIATWWL